MNQNDETARAIRPGKGATQFPPAAFEEWFAEIETGDGTIPVPQSIADGDAWHEHIGRRQIALGAWIAATEAALAGSQEEGVGVKDWRETLQLKCTDWGAYWRAPDAHGVELTYIQALELLNDVLGVEVNIITAANRKATTPDAAAPDGDALIRDNG